ncbi:hypothetical protein WT15_20555 [Burkholderia stagnalis]|uniref:hypothetical protein n=2 Tax=Burkholderia TaxID=32008 RepID=UPI0007593C88|nr:hypothetical protein [Burkholderia stagnalis]KVN75937.1 hypothetical protein WT15_20555 [Burkholderia stagnalis]KWO40564.1 hypothetical protein WT95_00305 [Burkholderia stagnalis]
MNDCVLLPWEGEDELAEAKAAARAAQRECLANGGRPVEVTVNSDAPAGVPASDDRWDTEIASTPTDLPEIGAFVRSMGGLNSVAIFKDLVAADLMTHRAGRYQQRSRKTGDVEWFRSVKVGRGHAVYVTRAGQDLIRQLKKDGKLTKALTKQPLTPRQKREREKARKVAKEKREAQKVAQAVSRPAVLAKLDQTIDGCIERRAAARERRSSAAKGLRR